MNNKNIEWWHPDYEFFGEFYHFGDHSVEGHNVLYQQKSLDERTNDEVKMIIKYCKPQKGASILDCPCGSGRHSVALAEKGFNVTGIDINEKMLSFHKEFIKSNMPKDLIFQKGDMRDLCLNNNQFDLIINMYISFGFFSDEENVKVVREFYRLLKPGGKLLIHLDLNYDNVINHKFFGQEHISRRCVYLGKKRRLEIKEYYDIASKRLRGEWKLLNGMREIKKYELRIYSNQSEFIPLFEKQGFSNVELIDPITGRSVTSQSVDTLLIATK